MFGQNEASSQETMEAKVEKIIEEKEIVPEGSEDKQLYQKLELRITSGDLLKDRIIFTESGKFPAVNLPKYKVGDKVVISSNTTNDGKTYMIIDYVRRKPLYILFAFFALVTFLVARRQGISSIIGMAFSFFVIFKFILPQILSGRDPMGVAVFGAIIIVPFTFILSHGFNKKTMLAIISTALTLIATGILVDMFVNLSNLTGFATEESSFLQSARPGIVNMKGLLMAGIIIGVLGILDDITVAQTSVVRQLKEANLNLTAGELYKKAMSVGRDHIASMVNTLVLVYAGASLPLLLLFIDNPRPFSEVINYEIIADEIVRTLVGSIGLVLAVPISTLISSLVYAREKIFAP